MVGRDSVYGLREECFDGDDDDEEEAGFRARLKKGKPKQSRSGLAKGGRGGRRSLGGSPLGGGGR